MDRNVLSSKPYQSPLIQILSDRGFIYQATDLEGLDAWAASGPVMGYIGFDVTAPSLHVGSLVQIMLLRWLQRCGHRVLVVVGGGTTRVGDPTGKEEARPLLEESQILQNTQGIAQVLKSYLSLAQDDVVLLDNHDWLKGLSYVETLRTYGRHLSVNRMMGFESIKQRLNREQHLSFLEFNYMVLQAIDFVTLAQKHDCRLQMGGADQWGNIVCGVDLGRKMGLSPLYGLTTPLITTAQGHKMGKTSAGAVWLSADRMSPHDYWQFWRNTHDADVGRFLRLFTDMPLEEIQALDRLQGQDLNQAKIVLADQATALCHGDDVLPHIHRHVGHFFRNAPHHERQENLSPDLTLTHQEAMSLTIADLLHRLKWVQSKSEGRRMIRQGSVRIQETLIEDECATLQPYRALHVLLKLSMGKKKYALIKIESQDESSSQNSPASAFSA